ncbi:MAG: PqqD family protein [Lachnospiraceae bacterium]|nr:PqqD family protein [Lachnospiraceae bacterium]
MKKNKNVLSENYLEKIPQRPEGLDWSADDAGIVTLQVHNTGFVNRLAQKLFKKPPISYIHLDAIGSFVWPLLDGEKNILELGQLVEERFGDEAQPLYERLAKYFQILDSYHFIRWAQM